MVVAAMPGTMLMMGMLAAGPMMAAIAMMGGVLLAHFCTDDCMLRFATCDGEARHLASNPQKFGKARHLALKS